jgi:RsiW-degrading membrane proteinase PrsW (M82 family)
VAGKLSPPLFLLIQVVALSVFDYDIHMIIIALIVATAIPLIFLYILYSLDLYKTGAFGYIVLCFLWGGLAFLGAYLINPLVVDTGLLSWDAMVRFSAPIVEEILKALILIYLVRRTNFTYFVDGAIYGFSVGIGFAIFENYQYLLGSSTALNLAISRVISTNLMHASASAMVGIALGLSRFQRSSGRVLLLIAGWLCAMSVHVAFNNLVTRVSSGYLLLFAAAVGFLGAGLIALAIKRGLAEEKAWIEETLGAADRVTVGEAAVVQRLSELQKILDPLAERFGPEKASAIERFLLLQARLGILRKTLEKLHDEKMKQAVDAQMAELRTEMDSARRAVGTYCMLYLRNIFPAEASPLWGRLETLIPEQAASRSGSTNLWSTLGQRTAAATERNTGSEV